MLSAGSGVTYISEPLNLWHRPGVLRTPVDFWYTYICEENQDKYLPSFREMLQFEYHTCREIRSLRNLKDMGRFLRDWNTFSAGRRHKDRILIKDPFAIFSAPWFYQALDCQVVITVRHPAAVVSSLMRLNWAFDFSHLLSQNLLMRDHLEPFREDMDAVKKDPQDILDQASLLWRIIYSTAAVFQSRYERFQIVRHEDLSRNPIDSFAVLYNKLGLEFSINVEEKINESTRAGNPLERPDDDVYATQLDSRANLQNWKTRLSPQEIDRIRNLTGDTTKHYYADDSWD